jgi:hypothetical protein
MEREARDSALAKCKEELKEDHKIDWNWREWKD